MNTVSVGLIALYFLATSLVTLDAFSAYPNVGFAGYLSKKCSGMGGEIYSKNLCGELSILKYNGEVSKWNSTVVALRDYSLKELQLQTRVSFATDDLLSDIVNSALKEGRQFEAFQTRNVVAALASSVLVPSFLLPTLPLPDFAKNVIGLLSIFSPFLVLGIGFLKPEAVVGGDPTNERDIEMLTDRISYHEAGHFLLGYICGLPITSYDVSGEKDASLTLEIPDFQSSQRDISFVAGRLLVVSVAGVVAETLRFGVSNGGVDDLTVAATILNDLKEKKIIERRGSSDGYIRWAIGKALQLLRIHRDALDSVAEDMRAGKSIFECIETIENTLFGDEEEAMQCLEDNCCRYQLISVTEVIELAAVRRAATYAIASLEKDHCFANDLYHSNPFLSTVPVDCLDGHSFAQALLIYFKMM